MREILFRGKRVDNGEWVHGAFAPDALETSHGDMVTWGFIRRFNRDTEHMETIEVDRVTVGQFTGLVDKEKKRIFEGDLLEWDGQSMDTYKVVYGVDACFFGVPVNGKLKEVAGQSLSLLNADLSTVIVGNVHDNPEMAKGAEHERD